MSSSASNAISRPYAPDQESPLPGDLAMWFFILAELSVFALMFIAFSWLRTTEREVFLAGQALLHPGAGLINTLVLLTASVMAAEGVRANRLNRQGAASRWLMGAILISLVYVVIKLWEYAVLGQAGYGLNGNRFFMAYFLLTGVHFMHVLLGLVILGYMAGKLRRRGYGPDKVVGLESGVCYWHMVDLLWIVLFPLVYVIQ